MSNKCIQIDDDDVDDDKRLSIRVAYSSHIAIEDFCDLLLRSA